MSMNKTDLKSLQKIFRWCTFKYIQNSQFMNLQDKTKLRDYKNNSKTRC